MAGLWDYFKAGAQDFGTDASNMINGRGGSPTMTARQVLWNSEPASFAARFGAMGGGRPAPAVPADGSMQPTIGPGAAASAAAPQAPVKMGLPPGGIIGLLQGQSPQGLIGMLQRAMPQGAGAPLAGGMPQAGMLPGMPGAPPATPPAAPPQLPMDINPMNQF